MNYTAKHLTTTPEPFVFQRRIGSTIYRVRLNFNPEAKETLDEKIVRLLKNDLQAAPENVKMEPLQAGWLSERGSL